MPCNMGARTIFSAIFALRVLESVSKPCNMLPQQKRCVENCRHYVTRHQLLAQHFCASHSVYHLNFLARVFLCLTINDLIGSWFCLRLFHWSKKLLWQARYKNNNNPNLQFWETSSQYIWPEAYASDPACNRIIANDVNIACLKEKENKGGLAATNLFCI